MQNLSRRSSGVYVTRLTVPERLRPSLGKRELIASTGVRDLYLAKIVSTAQLAQWRRRFFELDKAKLSVSMNHDTLLKIATGDPVLGQGGHMGLVQAAAACGLAEDQLLRLVGAGKLVLHVRLAGVQGVLLPIEKLVIHGGSGERDVPIRSMMPADAIDHVGSGIYAFDRVDRSAIAAEFLKGEDSISVVLLMSAVPNVAFIPDVALSVNRADLEVDAAELDAVRQAVASRIDPVELEVARAARSNAAAVSVATALASVATSSGRASFAGSKHADKRLSDAIDAYAKGYLPQGNKIADAIAQQRRELDLLVEFEGDEVVGAFDSDRLRDFRDNKLSTFLARENHARRKFGTKSMKESIGAAAGTWPLMSVAERDVRMQRIKRMFRWLHDQKWIADDPGTALRGESVAPKSARTRAVAAKVDREPFTTDELQRIFSTSWFQKGRGELTASETYREFQPFQFWLPLLGLLAGCRSGEASQLWLVFNCVS